MAQQFTKQEIMKMFELTSEEFELLKGDKEKIHKCFRRIAAKYHPDQNPEDSTATEKFQRIQAMEAAFVNNDYVDEFKYSFSTREQKGKTDDKARYQQEDFQKYAYADSCENSWDTGYYHAGPKKKRSVWWHLTFPIRGMVYLVLLGLGYALYALASLCTIGAGIAYCVAGLRLLYNIFTRNWLLEEIVLEIVVIAIVFLVGFLYEKLGNWLEEVKEWLAIHLF